MFVRGMVALRCKLKLENAYFSSNSDSLTAALTHRWQLAGISETVHVRNLGTDATDGAKRHTSIQKSRFVKSIQRGRRLKRLREAGAGVGHVQRAGPTATAIWGATVVGIPPSQMHRLRVAAVAEGIGYDVASVDTH